MTLNPNKGLDLSAIAAAQDRYDAQDARAEARAAEQGYNASRCDTCGTVRTLNWLNGHCNEYDAQGLDEMCGGRFRATTVLPARNPVTGTRPLRFRAGEEARS